MTYNYPHTITNGSGEEITFIELVRDKDGDWLRVKNQVTPGAGPPMHVHHLQDECLTVIQGTIATQVEGQEPKFYGPGSTALFKRGEPHRFWNAGDDVLICEGWIKPAYNIEYFLGGIFKSTEENGGKRPGMFDSAWLMSKYKTEFDMMEIPGFVKKVIFPIVNFFGRLGGKHRKFKGAPKAYT